MGHGICGPPTRPPPLLAKLYAEQLVALSTLGQRQDHLRASGHFSMVAMYTGRPDFDYVFSGKLEKLEEMDYEGGVQGGSCIVCTDRQRRDWCNALEQCRFRGGNDVPTNSTRGRV